MNVVPPDAATSNDGLYRIATVSNLTGIPVQTIRAWESRHGIVQPVRSATNVRMYRRADIERLSLVKAAVDAGHAIGTLAPLTDDQIRSRFKDAPPRTTMAPESFCRVLVCGEALGATLTKAWSTRSDVRVQATLPSLADGHFESLGTMDAVIVDAPVLKNGLPPALKQLRAATRAPVAIVVYGFGSHHLLARLDHANVIALAAPTDPAQLARICQLGLAIEAEPPTPFAQILRHPAGLRRYHDLSLNELTQVPSKVVCECPNHLAGLLLRLNAFERYSLECESTNVADASMHAMLFSVSGHCRELLEEALRRVLVHEGIPEPR
jgi:hypothetical protein